MRTHLGLVIRRSECTRQEKSYRARKQRSLEQKLQQQDLTPEEYSAETQTLVDEPDTPAPAVHILDEMGTFDAVTIWGHDLVPDTRESPFGRSLREWLDFAQTVGT